MFDWERMSQVYGTKPLVSTVMGGDTPLRVERYLYSARAIQNPPLDNMLLGILLGGNRTREGLGEETKNFIPGTGGLLPAGQSFDFELTGAIDVALFYFLDQQAPVVQRLLQIMESRTRIVPISDPLIGITAQQLIEEVSRGPATDRQFARQLRGVMLEQLCRIVTGTAGQHLHTESLQLQRLSSLLKWIRENLQQPLDGAALAAQIEVSESHLRRLFQLSMGCSPHRFIMRLRLERVCELLTQTALSIPRIASECGFQSQSHMTASFHRTYGMPPARFRRHLTAFNVGE